MAKTKGKDQNELAEDRTDMAGSRSRMAAERTFTAWIRTALSCMGIGIAVISFLAQADETGTVIRLMGTGVVLLGVWALYLGFASYRQALRDLPEDEEERLRGGLWHFGLFGVVLSLAAAAALYVVW